jgi:hypothetical protein
MSLRDNLVLSGRDFSIPGLLPLVFQTKQALASARGLGFVSGHDFSRAAHPNFCAALKAAFRALF